MSAIEEIAAERTRQILSEGFSCKRDDYEHSRGQLAVAGAAYALNVCRETLDLRGGRFGRTVSVSLPGLIWPWSEDWWKPKDARRDLIRAGALIVAEIERLDRLSARVSPKDDGNG